ncbi:MAG: DUF2066 domain-containing protein [Gammaproteobacteria bacterium]|jgi:hypothetical protein|nr:DUF2066 domain-containing protein [Gammaproteobacteria bacterium]
MLFFSVGAALPVLAVDVPTLFTAEVLLDEESDNPREDAYRAALISVLTKVSGSELGANEVAIDEMFPVPAAYVTQFRPGEEDTLWVSFDGEAVERVLRASGQTVWGSDRPLTLVWLAVDWGQGEREIIAAGDSDGLTQEARSIDRNRLLRERVLEIAEKRGLPIAFPLLDTTDLQGVTFSDIWGGFDDRVIDASQRYEANSILIGRVKPSSGQLNRWTYVFGDETRAWTGPAEAMVAQVADMLAAEFAVGGDAPLEMLALNVSGVQTVDAYGSLQEILSGVNLIESFKILEVTGDVVSYQIEVRGGADRLRRALRFAGLLEQTDSQDYSDLGPRTALEFFYSP